MQTSFPKVRSAVILAAGRGRRLGSHTNNLPKPLIRILGKPILDYILSNLAYVGVNRVLLIVGYLSEHIRSAYSYNSKYGLNISFAEQTEQSGTGAATLLSRKFVGNEPFFLGWGDSLATINEYGRLFETFKQKQPEALMMLNYVKNTQAGAEVNLQNGKIISIKEKPEEPNSGWNQAGMAIYKPSIFTLLEKLTTSIRGEIEFTDAVKDLISTDAEVMGIPMETERLHISTAADISLTEEVIKCDKRYRINIAE